METTILVPLGITLFKTVAWAVGGSEAADGVEHAEGVVSGFLRLARSPKNRAQGGEQLAKDLCRQVEAYIQGSSETGMSVTLTGRRLLRAW